MSVKDRVSEQGIADRLKAAREHMELTQDEWKDRLREKTGYEVSKGGVSQYERGMRVPAAYVASVCDAFGLSPEWVLWDEGPMARPVQGAEAGAYRVIAEIVESVEEGGDPISAAFDALEVLRLAEEAGGDDESGQGAA